MEKKLKKQIRRLIALFALALGISGITASFLETELKGLMQFFEVDSLLGSWFQSSLEGMHYLNNEFPQLAYGFDWLAFAHLVIAGFLIGPWRNPIQNKWVIQYIMLVCLATFPLAFFAGYFRQIPFYWQLIDCSFGAIGLVVLWNIYIKIQKLESIQPNTLNSL